MGKMTRVVIRKYAEALYDPKGLESLEEIETRLVSEIFGGKYEKNT